MWIAFQNNYSHGVYPVGYYYPNCPDGGDWGKEGWRRLNPGQSEPYSGRQMNIHCFTQRLTMVLSGLGRMERSSPTKPSIGVGIQEVAMGKVWA